MNFFDHLGKKVSDAGKGVAQQTKNLTEIARLTSVIDTEEKMLAQSYAQIGRTYYENHKNDPEAECAAQLALINKSLAKIAQWRDQIQQIKGIVKCPHCGAEIPYGSQFCSTCGTRLLRSEAAPSARRCPCCGAEAAVNDRFCNKCGKPLPPESPAPARLQPAPVAAAPSVVSGSSFGYSAPVQMNPSYAPPAPATPEISLPVETTVPPEVSASAEKSASSEAPASIEGSALPETSAPAAAPAVSESAASVEEPAVPEMPVSAEEHAAQCASNVLPPQPRFCPSCGAEAEAGDRFCNKCGRPLF